MTEPPAAGKWFCLLRENFDKLLILFLIAFGLTGLGLMLAWRLD